MCVAQCLLNWRYQPHAQSVLSNKIFASELGRKFIKVALLVGVDCTHSTKSLYGGLVRFCLLPHVDVNYGIIVPTTLQKLKSRLHFFSPSSVLKFKAFFPFKELLPERGKNAIKKFYTQKKLLHFSALLHSRG